jgi:EmrB/QacA subfamily drug resistance transporter
MQSNDKRWWVMVGVGMASFIGCIDFTIVNTALPTIQQSLHLTFTQLQWIMNIFMFMLPVFLVIGGRLGDVYGARRILYASVIVFGLTSLGAGLSDTITPLLIYRGLQGIAAALMFPCAAAVVLNAFPEDQQGRALGILYSIFGIGLAIGPVIGGVIVEFLNWRWIFLVNVPIIIVSFLICLPSVKKSPVNNTEKLDWRGVLLLLVGLGCLIIAIAEGNTVGWDSATIISLFVVGVIVSIIWWRHELHSASPTLNFRLFKNRNIIASLIGSMVLGAFYCLGFFLMPLYLDNIRHLSAFYTGAMLMATSLFVAILSPIMGFVMDRYPVKYLICTGLLCFVISGGMQVYFNLDTSYIFIIFSFAFFGIAWGMIGAPLIAALIQALPRDATGVATGTLWTVQNVGAVLGLAVGTALFQFYSGVHISQNMTPHAFINGYRAAMYLLLAFSAAVFIFTALVMKMDNTSLNSSAEKDPLP